MGAGRCCESMTVSTRAVVGITSTTLRCTRLHGQGAKQSVCDTQRGLASRVGDAVGTVSKARKTPNRQCKGGQTKSNEVVGNRRHHMQWHAPRELG